MTRAVVLCAGALLLAAGARAQTPDSLAAPRPVPTFDSLRTAPAVPMLAAPDSSQAPTPGEAVRRSLLVPGWGQLANGQTVKAPIAAGAVAGAVVYAVVRQVQYTRLRRAALYAGCLASPDRDVCTDVSDAEDEWLALGSPTFAAVSPVRDQRRGQRDVAVLLVGVAYALQALDAYVAAELADFDVSEDLSLHVAPGPGGATLAARWRL